MVPAPGTFERVYASIKRWLRRGDFRAGERLEPGMLSERLNASVTPVRDALHRLTGERLVDSPPHEGFRVPLASEMTLRWLYGWHRDLVLLAIARRSTWPRPPDPERLSAGGPVEHEQALFLRLAEAGGNPEHVEALRSLLDRLEPYQRLETDLLETVEDEVAAIANVVENGDRALLRRLLATYYRRRERIVPLLVSRAGRS